MRELRSCDFCGDDAAGTFGVVPPELEPTEAEQRRVVLCPDCKDRLERLLEPLLARAGIDGETERTTATSHGDAGSEPGTVVASADESTRRRARDSSPNATVSGTEGSDGDAGPDPDPALEDGITVERSSPPETDDDGDGSTDEDATDTIPDEPVDDGPNGPDDTGGQRESADDGAATARQSTTRPPRAYSKVVRLLRNREFPMKRSAVENLAAGAYDLESHEVEAIVDYAIDDGEFVEDRGTLSRPGD